MANSLRTLLKLPTIRPIQRTTQHDEFVKEFRLRIGRVNDNLQKVAAQAGRSVHKPLDDLRIKVIAAQHKALELIDPTNAGKAEPVINRVLEALDAVDQKVSQAAESVGADRKLWLELEEELDEIVQQSSELEDAGHPKAPVIRKIGEAARDRAKAGKFQEAVVAVNQLRPKFQQILADQQDQPNAEVASDVAQRPTEEGSREGLTILVKDQTTGEAIEGVRVTVGDQADTTNSHGLATFELPVGIHDYNVTADGYEATGDSVEIVAGDNPELVIEMISGADGSVREGLTVFVRDWESGDPVEGAQVRVGEETDSTSSNGLATLELPVGTHEYDVSLDGYDSASSQVEIYEGDNSELLVELVRSGVPREGLTVLVRKSESGEVIEGAEVSIGGTSDVTSSNGLATLELPVGTHSYEIAAEGFSSQSGDVEVVAGDNTELVIDLICDEQSGQDEALLGDDEDVDDDDDLTDELADAERFVVLWDETLDDVAGQVERLRQAMASADDFGTRAVYEGLATVMEKFPDLDLQRLVANAKADDQEAFEKTLEQTAREIRQVRELLANGPLLSTIDRNPYIKTNVHATVNQVLNEIVDELDVKIQNPKPKLKLAKAKRTTRTLKKINR